MINKKLLLLSVALLFCASLISTAQVRVSKLFSNDMVIQRNVEFPVWGWAEKGERITVLFEDKSYEAKPDNSGKWTVVLPAMLAGGPYEIQISGKNNNIDIGNVLFGDVWVCSGQSNMAWLVKNSNNSTAEMAAASDNQIRHFKIPNSSAKTPESELTGGMWELTNPDNVGEFTAVGYFFARELRKHVDVPIGLINTSWGGSRIEPWMSISTLGIKQSDIDEIYAKEERESQVRLENFQSQFGELSEKDLGMEGENFLWSDPDLDESIWQEAVLPGNWENGGYEGLDGIGWYRKSFNLSSEEAENGIEIGLGMIDDSDIAWVNGTRVGGMNQSWDVPRTYKVDPAVLRSGRNVIVIRVEDTGGGGGVHGESDLMYIKTSSGTSGLDGKWNFRIGAYVANSSIRPNQLPTLLYNKMVYPILDFPVKGVLWYQGESNANDDDEARAYEKLFKDMITDWRAAWKNPYMPFLYVQLANFRQPDSLPTSSPWALLRESQSAALDLPNTGQAVIIDIGNADDIHPRNKQDVGLRISLAARKLGYGQEIFFSGPVFKSHVVEGSKIVISFDHTGSGLMVKDKYGYLKGFAIAGVDKKFVWAQASVDGNKVTVWNDSIENPISVRYAWGTNPDDANLYNLERLPASPFRTDK